MRITELELRGIIREELDKHIDEMAWGGHIGTAEDEILPHNPDYVASDLSSFNDLGASRSTSKKYAQSKSWADKAFQHYSNLPFTLWTAPYIGSGKGDKLEKLGIMPTLSFSSYSDENRLRIFPLEESLEKLSELGYDVARIKPNDVVILYTSVSTRNDFKASPWTLIHSLFDSYNFKFSEITAGWDAQGGDGFISSVKWMTMSSAKNGQIGSPSDAGAEAVTQELLDKRGFHLMPVSKDGKKLSPKHAALVIKRVKEVANEFRKNAPGHLFTVVVN
jgi:hypothetical protein